MSAEASHSGLCHIHHIFIWFCTTYWPWWTIGWLLLSLTCKKCMHSLRLYMEKNKIHNKGMTILTIFHPTWALHLEQYMLAISVWVVWPPSLTSTDLTLVGAWSIAFLPSKFTFIKPLPYAIWYICFMDPANCKQTCNIIFKTKTHAIFKFKILRVITKEEPTLLPTPMWSKFLQE